MSELTPETLMNLIFLAECEIEEPVVTPAPEGWIRTMRQALIELRAEYKRTRPINGHLAAVGQGAPYVSNGAKVGQGPRKKAENV